MLATNPISKSDPFSDSHFKMKLPVGFIAFILGGILFAGCQSYLRSAPPITESFIQAGLREKADGRTLAEGRKVFLNRCIGCHALPEIARYDRERIPHIVGWMSGRAHLTPVQKEAVTKYLLTARAQ